MIWRGFSKRGKKPLPIRLTGLFAKIILPANCEQTYQLRPLQTFQTEDLWPTCLGLYKHGYVCAAREGT